MWLTADQARLLVARHDSPLFVYSRTMLAERADSLINLQLPFGHTVRYALKANPYPEIIQLLHTRGLHFDASSSYEASELLGQGVPGNHISLSSQQPAHNLSELLAAGVRFVATSMRQLELFAAAAGSGVSVALRVNPPVGSGHTRRTTTGGVASSFGLWHAYLDDALAYADRHHITIDRLHVHVGSGADPAVWGMVMDSALQLVRRMPEVTTLDIGGGYKVRRAVSEAEADMAAIATLFADRLQQFANNTGRRLRLEIEPGTWLVAHAGILLAEVVDIVDTGPTAAGGYTFLRLNTGMNDIIRPALYGAQHDIVVLNNARQRAGYVVVGHNCETGDILTPAPGDPEQLAPRRLRRARIGDLVAIADVGAYCASFSAKDYNAFPSAGQICVD